MRRIGVMLGLLVSPLLCAPDAAGRVFAQAAHQQSGSYVCPMHPEVTAAHPGSCTRCGMKLERVDPHEPGSTYRLQVGTTPLRIETGRPFTMQLAVRPPAGDDIVKDFAVVHEKPFHLFVVSRDLEVYHHLHPVQDPTGVWVQELTLAQPGSYKVYADILPKGAMPQLLTQPLEVGPAGAPAAATLVPDATLDRTVGNVRVQLTLPEGGLTANSHQSLAFQFTDARSGAPVRDLEPYLGAWGHTVMISADMEHFVHAHPVEPVAGTGGGPQLTFSASAKSPGIYRLWTQIMRGGEVETIVFTVPVKPGR